MKKLTVIAFLACCGAHLAPSEAFAIRGASSDVQTHQGTLPAGDAPPRDDLTLRFDQNSKRFILKNPGKEPIWVFAYGTKAPFTKVERLTRDGWVESGG